MNREKANKLLGIFNEGSSIGTTSNGTKLVFARQSIKDVEQIEKATDKKLINEWKSLCVINHFIGQVSLNEMERISLIELEMDDRDNINKEELTDWFKQESKKDYEV